MLSNPDPPGRIMVVDDDATIVDVVRRYLVRDGHEVECVPDGPTALRLVQQEPPDLVVLDLMLPGMGGLEVCRRLREHWLIPVVMLTALGEETDRVVGFETGADDYVTKPFSPRELLARVRSAMRRSSRMPSGDVAAFGDVRVDFLKMELTRNGRVVQLTAQEFKILKFMLQNPERVISREELLNTVWGYQNYPSTRTVDNHILKLRQKLEKDPSNPVHFRTVHSSGYKFVP